MLLANVHVYESLLIPCPDQEPVIGKDIYGVCTFWNYNEIYRNLKIVIIFHESLNLKWPECLHLLQ